ncbi:MAG: hypothetical protein OXG65_14660 [Chloroflexi bacterium]|nr:hypothetical protein [Chloroflexota bacterium]
MPDMLDDALLKRAGVAQGSWSGVRRCFKSFLFTDEDDGFTALGKSLRGTGPDSHKAALKALDSCYPFLWPRAQEDGFSFDELDEYVTVHMQQGEAARANARKTFVWLVRLSGNVEVANRLEPTRESSSRQTVKKRPARISGGARKAGQSSNEDSSSTQEDAQTVHLKTANAESPQQLDRFGVLAQVLNIRIDASSSPELVREVRDLLVTLLDPERSDGHDANS